MKRLLVSVAAALVVAALPVWAAAQETKTVTGTVTAVAADSITVKTASGEMKFGIDAKTDLIARGGSTQTRAAQAEGKPGVPFSELIKTGQGVEVKYHEAGMHAATVRVLPSPPSEKAMAASEAPKTMTASGTVSAVSGSSLTVKTNEGDMTFALDDKTTVIGVGAGTASRAKQAAGEKPVITDFVGDGDSVTVRYHDMAGMKHAAEIRVTKKKM